MGSLCPKMVSELLIFSVVVAQENVPGKENTVVQSLLDTPWIYWHPE